MSAGRIGLVVAADLARANTFFLGSDSARQTPFAALARVDDKRGSKARHTHHLIRLQDVFDQETLDVAQPHVLVGVTEKDDAVVAWLRTRCVSSVNVKRSISGSPAGFQTRQSDFRPRPHAARCQTCRDRWSSGKTG